ncbi:hypothetical protein ACS0TY_034572 [Phlomoides rotata]
MKNLVNFPKYKIQAAKLVGAAKKKSTAVEMNPTAEKDTDEVYAQITLMLEAEDMKQQTPTQELIAKDLHGTEWYFKHIFRGQPWRHLLTTGWSTFVTSKRLVTGDSFVFLREETGELCVGVRRYARQQSSMPSSVISSQSVPLGVLATASHVVLTQSFFVVYYKPRTSQFIISLNKYLEAINHDFGVGMRFKMCFEGEDSPERRGYFELLKVLLISPIYQVSGTIVGVEDISPQWDNSKWRTLKVQWDEPASIPRPERVSPWEIKPFVASVPTTLIQPLTFKHKRLRQHIEIPTPEPMASTASPTWNLTHDAHQKNQAFERQRSIHMANSHAKQTDFGTTLLKHNNSSTLSTHIDGVWHSSLHVNASPIMNGEETEENKCASAWSVISNHSASSSGKQFNTPVSACTDVRQPNVFPSCRLFGFDLKSPSTVSLKPVDISNDGVELYTSSMLSSCDLE